MRRIRLIIVSLLGFGTALFSPLLSRCLAALLCTIFSLNAVLCNYPLNALSSDTANATNSNNILIAQAGYCNTGTVISTGMNSGFDGQMYFISYDYTHGIEAENPQACGREYQSQPDPTQPNYGIKFVYLVDGFKNRVSSVLYTELADGKLQVFSSNKASSNSQASRSSVSRTITSLDDSLENTDNSIKKDRSFSNNQKTDTSTTNTQISNTTTINTLTNPTLIAPSLVTQNIDLTSNIKINFQPDSSPVPAGYVKDTGLAYNDSRGFGWVRQDSLNSSTHIPLDISPNTRDRNRTSIDPRLNTIIHMQYPTSATSTTAVKIPAAWEYAIPNGTYNVTVSVGDQSPYDSLHRINVEGINAINFFQGSSNQEFKKATVRVSVSDGKLTIDAIGGTNTKLNYIDITPAEPYLNIKINFQPDSAPVPSGYVKDIGLAYSDSRGFGWVRQDSLNGTRVPLDISPNTRDRNRTGIDQKLDTIIHMQFPYSVSSSTAVKIPAAWEYAIPSGTYDVTVSVGDQSPYDSLHTINIEGVKAIDQFQGSSTQEYKLATARVSVSDGKLTVDAISGTNTKLNYINIHTSDVDFLNVNWNTVTPAPIRRLEAIGDVLGGKLYVFGGYFDGTLAPTTRADVYDPVTNSWSRLPDLPIGLTHAGTSVEGRDIYIAGGYEGPGGGANQIFASNKVWKYNVDSRTYTAMPNLPQARGAGSLELLGRDLHFFGGVDINRVDKGDHWILSLDNIGAGWLTSTPMRTARNHTGDAAISGKLYSVGGLIGRNDAVGNQTVVEVWDPADPSAWKPVASMPRPLSHISGGTFVMGDRIVVLGGKTDGNINITDTIAYRPDLDIWESLAPLPATKSSGVGGTVNGFLYYTGGGLSTITYKGTPQ